MKTHILIWRLIATSKVARLAAWAVATLSDLVMRMRGAGVMPVSSLMARRTASTALVVGGLILASIAVATCAYVFVSSLASGYLVAGSVLYIGGVSVVLRIGSNPIDRSEKVGADGPGARVGPPFSEVL